MFTREAAGYEGRIALRKDHQAKQYASCCQRKIDRQRIAETPRSSNWNAGSVRGGFALFPRRLSSGNMRATVTGERAGSAGRFAVCSVLRILLACFVVVAALAACGWTGSARKSKRTVTADPSRSGA